MGSCDIIAQKTSGTTPKPAKPYDFQIEVKVTIWETWAEK
jgi:hypothetical protein